jgi:N4-gp56 family major capsid protein
MANMTWTDQGGYLSNGKLTKHFQKVAQPLMKFRQFVDVKVAFGKQAGQTVNYDRIGNVETIGRQISETETMPTTVLPITQGTLTVTEHGNSIPLTGKLLALSELKLKKHVDGALKDDAAKVIDGSIERKFNETKLRYVGTATGGYVLTTNGTATATNTSVLNEYHVSKMAYLLAKRNVPRINGDYVCILSVLAAEGLRRSMVTVNQYTEAGIKKVYNGEIGRLHGVRFVEDNFATAFIYSPTAGTATADTWTGGNSLNAYMFGMTTVMEAVAIPEEIRNKLPTDYGRSQGMAWYALLGWDLIWQTEANTRIIKWDSAA